MADRELVAALVRLLDPPNEQRRNDYTARITTALDQGRRNVPIPGVAARQVTVTVDWVTFMFCYPWRGPRDPYPDENFTRQPKAKWADQSTQDYGRWSFKTAGDNGIDVMVGFWSQLNEATGRQSVFHHFRDSIGWYVDGAGYRGPKVAYSMEYDNGSKPVVAGHLKDLAAEFKLNRHYRFPDRAGRQRVPVVFWGINEVLDQGRIDETATVLDTLAATNVGGATPYIIWHANLLDAWAGWKGHKETRDFADYLKKKVLRRIDAVYQHECDIPPPPAPLTWGQVNRHDWPAFPHARLDADATVAKTRWWKQLLADDAKEDEKNGQRPLDIQVIPGTMPQYSRERYDSAIQKPTERVTQIRVNCTDVKQVRTSLKNMRDEATSVSVEQTGPNALLARRMVALTSWNEFREGSTWEPGDANDNDPNLFGITDSTGVLLDTVKGVFADAVIEYTLGGGGGGGGDGGDKGGDKGGGKRGHDGRGDT